jgi:hypothetical protein
MIMKTKGLNSFVFWTLYFFTKASRHLDGSIYTSLFLEDVSVVAAYVPVLII